MANRFYRECNDCYKHGSYEVRGTLEKCGSCDGRGIMLTDEGKELQEFLDEAPEAQKRMTDFSKNQALHRALIATTKKKTKY
jgi:hypothetical protein